VGGGGDGPTAPLPSFPKNAYPVVVGNSEEWLNKVRGIVALTLRPSYGTDLERFIKSARTSDAPLESRHVLGDCVKWLNDWNGRFSQMNIRRDCKLGDLRAAMAAL